MSHSILKTALATAGALTLSAAAVMAEEQGEGPHAQIVNILSAYETALNASDIDAIVPLYAEDGVFMAQHSLPSVGADAVRAAYEGVFAAITLDISFEIDEIEQLSPGWAFARTRSSGTVTVNATGDAGAEANQELFLFTRGDDGGWKIARYIFSTTNPPRS